jgi:hypothetical protein
MVAPPPPGQGAQGQQAPFGQSPVTGPTPNKGFEAAALKRVGLVVKQLTELLPLAGAGTDVGKDILQAINMLVKHVPSGSVSPADEKGETERRSMANTQNNQQMQALRQSQQPPAGGQQAQAA